MDRVHKKILQNCRVHILFFWPYRVQKAFLLGLPGRNHHPVVVDDTNMYCCRIKRDKLTPPG